MIGLTGIGGRDELDEFVQLGLRCQRSGESHGHTLVPLAAFHKGKDLLESPLNGRELCILGVAFFLLFSKLLVHVVHEPIDELGGRQHARHGNAQFRVLRGGRRNGIAGPSVLGDLLEGSLGESDLGALHRICVAFVFICSAAKVRPWVEGWRRPGESPSRLGQAERDPRSRMIHGFFYFSSIYDSVDVAVRSIPLEVM